MEWVESNYINAASVKEEQDRHQERKKERKNKNVSHCLA
jgi:hypothetical protein